MKCCVSEERLQLTGGDEPLYNNVVLMNSLFTREADKLEGKKLKHAPGCLWAAEDMRDILQTAIGEWVHTSSELACHLVRKKAKGNKELR